VTQLIHSRIATPFTSRQAGRWELWFRRFSRASNHAFDRPAGSRALAAGAQRERSAAR
jgi:hypothetical protein